MQEEGVIKFDLRFTRHAPAPLDPFAELNRWRNMLAMVAQMDDRTIRNIGLGSMLLGVAVLYIFN